MTKIFYFKLEYTDFLFRLIIGVFATLFLLYVGYIKKNETLLILSFFFGLYSIVQFHKKGIEFNLQEMKFREFYSLFSIKIGEWKTLDKINYVNIYPSKKIKQAFVLRAPNRSIYVFTITLFYKNNNSLIIHSFREQNDAFRLAIDLKKLFNVPLYDATTEQPKWM